MGQKAFLTGKPVILLLAVLAASFAFFTSRPAFAAAPTVTGARFSPTTIASDNTTTTTATASVSGLGVVTVTIDLSPIGGATNAAMFDDGAHGDGGAADGVYGRTGITADFMTMSGSHTITINVNATGNVPANGSGTGILYTTIFQCGASAWPMFKCNTDRNSDSSDATPLNLTTGWTYTTGDNVISSPAVANGRVYVGTGFGGGGVDSKLYALNANTGALVWSYTMAAGGSIYSSPAVSGGRVYFGSTTGRLYCVVEATGLDCPNFPFGPTGGAVYSSPLVYNGVVFFGSMDWNVYAVDINTGVQKWSYTTGNGIQVASPLAFDGRIYIGSMDGSLYALDINTGAKAWSYTLTGQVNNSATVATAGGVTRIFVASGSDGKLYALDAYSNATLWVYPGDGGQIWSSPSVAHGKVYYSAWTSGIIYAVDQITGGMTWSKPIPGGASQEWSSPSIANGRVYVLGGNGVLYALNETDGNIDWSYDLGTVQGASSPAIANSMVYVGAYDKKVHAFVQSLPPVANSVTFTPSTLLADTYATTTVTVKVSDPNGLSDISGVTVDLTSIGGGASVALYDNATNGDLVAGDATFTKSLVTAASSTTPGAYAIIATVNDFSGLSATGSATLTITANTAPAITGCSFSPTFIRANGADPTTLTCTGISDANSNIMSVTADLTSIGGGASDTLTYSAGTTWTRSGITASVATPDGLYPIITTVADRAQAVATASANIAVDMASPVAGTVTVSNTATSTYVAASFDLTTTFSDNSSGVSYCDYCKSTDGTCDTEWASGSYSATTCSATSLACADGATLTLNMRAKDVAGNIATATAITRTCDAAGPVIGTITPANTDSGTRVDGTFDLSATVTDARSGVQYCDYCKSIDGTCDAEWASGTMGGGSCSVTGLTCANGATVTLNIRSRDNLSNAATGTQVSRLCDTATPTQSIWSPATGTAVMNTWQTVTFTTNENGDCKWSLTDQAYGAMGGDCTGDGTASQSCAVTGMTPNATNTIYVSCRDSVGNADTAASNTSGDYRVDSATPTQSIWSPATGTVIANTWQAVTFTTNENADCKWALADQAYGAMGGDCTGDGTTSQSCSVTGMTPNATNTVYVSCRDTAGNADTVGSNTSGDYKVDTATPTQSIWSPATGTVRANTWQTVTFTTNENADCKWALADQAYGTMGGDCTGDGTTSQSCSVTGMTPNATNTVYVSCRDTVGNADTVASNTSGDYRVDSATPTQSIWSPATGTVIANTWQAVTFTTNENADCKWALADAAYGGMAGDCTGDGTTNQSCVVTGMTPNATNTVYVSCRDTIGNADTIASNTSGDYRVDSATPTQSIWSPATGTVIANTWQTVTFTTSENGDCKWALADAAYGGMAGDCTGDGTTSQSCTVTGMTPNATNTVYVSCRDTAGNADTVGSNTSGDYKVDTATPTQSIWSPATGTVRANTWQTVTFTTNENADCKWALADQAYGTMGGDCTGDGTTSQSCSVTGMTPNATNTVYVSCRDTVGNADTVASNTSGDYKIDTATPTQSIWSPATGTVIANTWQTVTFTTNENGDCKWSLADAAYGGMAGDCTGDGTTNQSCAVTGMTPNATNTVYVSCRDTIGNADTIASNTSGDYRVDSATPTQSIWSPATGTVIANTWQTVTFTTNENGDCKWALADAAYGGMAGDCTGDGTTSQSCAVTGMTPNATNTVYVSCRDTIGNADTIASNTSGDYRVDSATPTQSIWSPATGTVITNTWQTVTFTTNENGDCKWALADAAYGAMAGDCTGDGTTSQSCSVTGMTPNATNTVYVSCRDTVGNADTIASNTSGDYRVDSATPTQSIWSPATGTVIANTWQTVTFTTSENGDCKWSLADAAYGGMAGDCTGDGTTNQSCVVTGMTPNATNTVYVSCRDTIGNADTIASNTSGDYRVDSATPTQSIWSPATGTVIANTWQTVTFTTNENGDCKWALADAAYGGMAGDCTGDGTTSQSCAVTGMTPNATNTVYVSCRDTIGNADTIASNTSGDYRVDSATPTQSIWSPATGTVIANTWQTVTFTTNENGDCKWSLADAAYGGMAGDCTGDGTTSQSCVVTGMTANATNTVYVSCRDTIGNADTIASNTSGDYKVDTATPTQSIWSPATGTVIANTWQAVTFTTNENADCKWALADQAYGAMGGDCTGDGTTSQSCTVTGMTPNATNTVYVSCRDTIGNADTVASNTSGDYKVDTATPTQSIWSPATGTVIANTSQTVTFTTNENGDCKWALADAAYGGMAGDCTGDGTTSQSCSVTGMTANATNTVYVSCRDTAGNADTLGSNTSGDYWVDTTGPAIGAVVPANTDTGAYVDGTFDLSATVTDTGSGVAYCDYCKATDGTCDTEWASGTIGGGNCSVTSLTCTNGQSLTLNIRAKDNTGNFATSTQVARTCDTAAPATGTVTPANTDNGTYVDATFDLGMTFTDAGAGVAYCDYCKSTDGTCDTEWASGTMGGGNCSVTGLACANGQSLTLNMRGRDNVGNAATATQVTRTCDAGGPAIGTITPANTDSGTYVDGTFDLGATVSDAGAGVAYCEYCKSTDGTCDTEWASGTMGGGNCAQTGLTCANGQALTLNIRAKDNTGNFATGTQVSRTCDTAAPATGTVTPANTDNGTYVDATFDLGMTFSDAGAGVAYCEYCKSTDGTCDTEWASGTMGGGNCSVTGLTCTNGQSLTLNMRGRDNVANAATATQVARTCDAGGPTIGAITPANTDTGTYVDGTFDLGATVTDAGAGVAYCDYCKSTDGTCDTEWASGTMGGGSCTQTGLTCTNGQSLTLNIRAKDNTGNFATGTQVSRTCDTTAPATGTVTPANTDNGTYVDGTFDLSMTFTDAGSGVASCDYCKATDGTCDTEWASGTMGGGVCSVTGLTCTNGQSLTLNMRGRDNALNAATATQVARTCDTLAPATGTVTPANTDTGTYVDGTFDLSMTFTDAGAGIAYCDYCKSTDGTCDTEWASGTMGGGNCSVTGLTCTNGQSLTLNIRGRDNVANAATATQVARTCDAGGPTIGAITPANTDNGTYVDGSFDLSAAVSDAGSGVAYCDYCKSTDGTCDTEWASGTMGGGNCSVTGLACANGQSLTLNIRAKDTAGNFATGTQVARTCDTTTPAAGAVTPANTDTGTSVDGTFDLSATFSDTGSGIASCDYCKATDGICDTEWASGTMGGGVCSVTGITCADGQSLTLNMRARDNVLNAATATQVARTCDAGGPAIGAITPANTDNGTYVDGTFDLDATVTDAGAGVAYCDYCKATDGTCDTEWASGTMGGGSCAVTGLTCANGQTLKLNIRAKDNTGNFATGTQVTRTCDTTTPTAGAVTPANTDTGTSVDATFDLSATFSDTGSGVAYCDYCKATDGTCDTEWASGTMGGGVCSVTGITCADGQSLTLNMRARDNVSNAATATQVARTCDAGGPAIGAITPANTDSGAYVDGAFDLGATVTDAGAGVAYCDYCKSTDGTCDTEWASGTMGGGSCSVVGLTCTGGQALTLNIRAKDNTGNFATGTQVARTCDTTAPAAGAVTPANTDTGTSVDGTFDLSMTFTDAGAGVASCDYCKATDGTCDTEWASGTMGGGVCSVTGLTCANGQSLTLNMRGRDNVLNAATATQVARTCDAGGPAIGAITPANTDSGTYVDGTFDLSATVSDAGSGVAYCDYCKATDGTCDTEWASGTMGGGSCSVAGLTCTNGQSLTLNIRAKDNTGNFATGTQVARTCDTTAPATGTVTPANTDTGTSVDGTFDLSMTFTDAGAGVASCDYCKSTDGTCDTEWASGTMGGGSCSVTGLTCANGQSLTLNMRGRDNVLNAATATQVARTCDAGGPTIGAITPANTDNGAYVDGAFDISATVTDAGAGVAYCDYCKSTDGTCDTEWASGTMGGGSCSVAGLTCAGGQSLTLNIRAKDNTGNFATGTQIARTCDTAGPVAGAVTPANTDTGTFVDATFDLSATFTDAGSGVAYCDYCKSTDGTCDTEWASGTMGGGSCAVTGLTCLDGQSLTLNMRARDNVTNAATATQVTRTCDAGGPAIGAVTPANLDTGTYVDATFDISATVSDAGAGIAYCDYCKSTDGTCDTEWASGTMGGGNCTVTGLTCANGQSLALNVRAKDTTGNFATGTQVARTCDTAGPVAGTITPANTDTGASVDGTFDLGATFTDASSGVAYCDYCKSTDGTCDTEWASGTMGGGNCTVTNINCSNGQSLTLNMRAKDNLQNLTTGTQVSRTCVTAGPVAGTVTPSNIDTGSFVDATFDLTTSFASGGAGVSYCEYCKATDGTCDTEWASGTMGGGNCSVTGLTCTNGQSLTLNMRAADTLSNVSTATQVTRTCDANGPAIGAVTPANLDTGTYVDATFDISATTSDAGAGVAYCEYCKSTDGTCDTEWASGTMGGGNCSVTGLTCANGQSLTLNIRAKDSAGNFATGTQVARTCDTAGPVAGTITPANTDTGASVDGTFDLGATFTDAASGVSYCEYCKATDGACDTEWASGTMGGGSCTVTNINCSNGQTLTLNMRAKDNLQNLTSGAQVSRTCVTAGPVAGTVTPSNIDTGSFVDATFDLTTAFASGGAGVSYCEYCKATDGTCDTEWASGTMGGGNCSVTGLTCTNGQALTLNMRAADTLSNVSTATQVTRTCDANGPAIGAVTPANLDTGTYVDATFDISATTTDAGAGVAYCEYCKSTDGTCDTEWASGTMGGGNCSVTGLTCTNGQALTLNVRAKDNTGNFATGTQVARTCDTAGPVAGVITPANTDTGTSVDGTFDLGATFTDAAAGVAYCEYCKATDGTCDTEWASGTMGAGSCAVTNITCVSGQSLTLNMRAKDNLQNLTTGAAVSRTCVTGGPIPGTVTPSNVDTGTYVDGAFDLTTSFGNGGAGVAYCEYCESTDGTCDTEWASGTIGGGNCSVTGLTCANGQALTLNMRAADTLSNVSTATAVMRTCDTSGPASGTVTPASVDTGAFVDGSFNLSATYTDAGSGVASCDYCKSTDGVCDTEWASGTFAAGVCSVTNITCADGQSLTLNMLGRDNTRNLTTSTAVARTCDAAAPAAGAITPSNTDTGTKVDGIFDLAAAFTETGSGVSYCEYCEATDGTCDTEWASGTFAAGACSVAGLTCTNGQTLKLNMRAKDNAQNLGSGAVITRTCDTAPPVPGSIVPASASSVATASPAITFTLNETGDCKWALADLSYAGMAGDCSGDGTVNISCAASGLTEGANTVYVSCQDSLANQNTATDNTQISYTVDTTPPVQSAWNPATGSTVATTSVTVALNINENGDCKWSLTDQAYAAMAGDCSGDGTMNISCAASGLAEGANTVYIACADTLGNSDTAASNTHIAYTVDTAMPLKSNWNPAKGSTLTTKSPAVTFDTDKIATCKWSLTDDAYTAMVNACAGAGTVNHNCAVAGLSEGAAMFYVACRDALGNQDTAASNEHVNYTVDTTPPAQSAWNPAKAATVATTTPAITLALNENGDCKWSLTDQAYGAMAGDCSGDGATNITCPAAGLGQGANTVYIACNDALGNANTAADNEHIGYTVDTSPPVQSAWSPASGATVTILAATTVTFNINENGDCKWSLTDDAYAAMAGDCSGDGGAAITCSVSGMAAGVQPVYFACADTLGNQDTALTNTSVSYNALAGPIDDGNPVVQITFPAAGAAISGTVTVTGTAKDMFLTSWTLSYGAGANPSKWADIATGTQSIASSTIAAWSAGAIAGVYTLKLSAIDQFGNQSTATVAVRVSNNLTITGKFPINKWLFVAMPVNPQPADPISLFGLSGVYKVYRWNPDKAPAQDLGKYEYPPELKAGDGFWIKVYDTEMNYSYSGALADTSGEKTVSLKTGYNMVGSPFMRDFQWNQVRVRDGAAEYDIAAAMGMGLLSSSALAYDSDAKTWKQYTDQDTMECEEGYAVRAYKNLELVFDPSVAQEETLARRAFVRVRKSPGDYRIKISARSTTSADEDNYFGAQQGSSDEFDGADLEEPMRAPGDKFVSLYFANNGWSRLAGRYTNDVRAASFDAGKTVSWNMDVDTNEANQPMTLSWNKAELPSDKYGFTLVDLASGARVDMAAQNTYTYTAADGVSTARFRIEVARTIAEPQIVKSYTLGRGWNLVSVPVEPEVTSAASQLGSSIDVRGVYQFNNGQFFSADKADIQAGVGYWIYAAGDSTINIKGLQPSPQTTVPLSRGWNIIGNPYETVMPWGDNITFSCGGASYTLSQAVAASVTDGRIFEYSSASDSYSPANSMLPWKGYFLKASQACDLVLSQ